MTRFASAVAAAALVFGLAAPPAALARGVTPALPQGLSIDSIRSGQPAPTDPTDDASDLSGLRSETAH